VQDIQALLHPDGAALRLTSGQEYGLRSTPRAATAAEVWLLGSSDYSARLAAKLGLPYVFAHHFSGEGTAHALDLYRSGFTPAAEGDVPRTFLTLNVSVAETAEEALALALPQLQSMARLRSGQPMLPLATVEEAAATTMTPPQDQLMRAMIARWVIGTPTDAAARVRELAAGFGVDEVMVTPGASAYAADDAATAPARVRSLELLAERILA
jgi:luciferase family oxidoreductase group 1